MKKMRNLAAALVFVQFLLVIPGLAQSQEFYEFDLMWPQLEQPWYFSGPGAIATDPSGNVYVADTNNCRIQKFTPEGGFICKWGSPGTGDGEFCWPQGIATDLSGNVYVADTDNHRIQKFTSEGEFICKWGSKGTGDGEFDWPQGIATNLSGNVYVADTWNNRIQKFRPAIISVHIQANGSDGPITVTPSDSVSIEVSLNPGDKTGQKADWWIAVNTPFVWPWNWYAYVYPTGWAQGVHMCVQAPLFALSPREVLNMALPPGEYTFYFAVDDPDGAAAGPWWGLDSVTVRVQ